MLDLGPLGPKYADVASHDLDGTRGSVYRALHAGLGRPVLIWALPRLSWGGSGETSTVFRRGACLAAGLQHRHILQVLDYEVSSTAHLMVTEHVRGETLAALLRRGGPLPIERAARIAEQLAEALEAAHAAGRLHRNLAPAEVVIQPDGSVKLGGFEAAVPIDSPPDELGDHDAAIEFLMGNPLALAPEQLRREQLTPRADVYALGGLLHQMLTGQPPFSSGRSWSVVFKKLHQDPPAPSRLRGGLPSELDELVLAMLARDPGRRPADMAEVRRRLQAFLPGTAEAPAPPADTLRRAIETFPYPIAIAAALLGADAAWMPRFYRLLDLFEATLKYTAAAALGTVLAATAGVDVDRGELGTLRRPSLGHWARYLDISTRPSAVDAPALRERLRDFYHGRSLGGRERGLEVIQHAIAMRNLFEHGTTRREADYEAAFAELQPRVLSLLGGLDFLADHPLAKVERLVFKGGRLAVVTRSYMGALPTLAPRSQVPVTVPLEDGSFGLFSSDGPFLDMTPFVVARTCLICNDEEVVYYNGMRGERKLTYLGYQRGHEFDIPVDVNPFERRGIVW